MCFGLIHPPKTMIYLTNNQYADVVRLENYHFFVQTMSPRQQRLLGSTALLPFIDQAQVGGSIDAQAVAVRAPAPPSARSFAHSCIGHQHNPPHPCTNTPHIGLPRGGGAALRGVVPRVRVPRAHQLLRAARGPHTQGKWARAYMRTCVCVYGWMDARCCLYEFTSSDVHPTKPPPNPNTNRSAPPTWPSTCPRPS